jgi:DNA (cytosine-5)-methyltransferase 1
MPPHAVEAQRLTGQLRARGDLGCLRVGSLFSGIGALDLAVLDVLGGRVAWHCENDADASRVLDHHWPGVPNLSDVTKVDWRNVEPVDVLTAGFPCQDISSAGRRLGIRPGTRSGLWTQTAYAISQLRPRLVVIENVRGLLSSSAACDVEPCPWCVGDPDDGPTLRALGAVLGDLASLGFDAEWVGLRAADVGACHGRFRVMVVAWPAAAHAAGPGRGQRDRAADARPGDSAGADGCRSQEPRRRDSAAPDPDREGPQGPESAGGRELPARGGAAGLDRRSVVDWGGYGPAVARWEGVLGRPAPGPVRVGRKGGTQLNPAFVEWMQGLPAGWVTAVPGHPVEALLPGLPADVTDVPGLSRAAMLRLLGNTVVPQWGREALLRCLSAAPGLAVAA